jgi:hypothetical protein
MEEAKVVLDYSNFAGQMISTGILIPVVIVLYRKMNEIINTAFSLQREHNETLKGVISENTKALQTSIIVMQKCHEK